MALTCEHDFKNIKRFGRADWRCPKCGENVMLYIVFAYEAGIDLINDKEVESGDSPEPTKRKYSKRVKKSGARACRNCGQPGHNSKTCPKGQPEDTPDEPGENTSLRCHSCGDDGHVARECPDLGKVIKGLKDKGFDSLKVAATLGIKLQLVNKHWNKEESFDEIHGPKEH